MGRTGKEVLIGKLMEGHFSVIDALCVFALVIRNQEIKNILHSYSYQVYKIGFSSCSWCGETEELLRKRNWTLLLQAALLILSCVWL